MLQLKRDPHTASGNIVATITNYAAVKTMGNV